MTGKMRKIDIIAHRGASAYAPENTLSAFYLAAALGADWFELDCTLTRDDALLVIHDDTVDRTTNGKGRVSDLMLAELKCLDAGTWKGEQFSGERLPTLEEALAVAKERSIGVFIEIKNSADDKTLMNHLATLREEQPTYTRRAAADLIKGSGSRNVLLAQKVLHAVKAQKMQHRVVIQSFSPVICIYLLEHAPASLRIEFLIAKDKDPSRWNQILELTHWLHPHGVNPNLEAVDPALIKQFHAHDQRIAVWTVDEPSDMRRIAEWGVDAIITNKPDVCLDVLADLGYRKPQDS